MQSACRLWKRGMARYYQRNSDFGFKIGAPSMVFGDDLATNVRILSGLVDHIEIVLFHTPTLHNIPTKDEINELRQILCNEPVTCSVHLPADLEVASADRTRRRKSIDLAVDLIKLFHELDPEHVVLHIPFTEPTLTPVPGLYFTPADHRRFEQWSPRAVEALERIRAATGVSQSILVENINYSPVFLEPLLHMDLCRLCLDFGHLVLGQEPVMQTADTYLSYTGEVHWHGIRDYDEHLSLEVLPRSRVRRWLAALVASGFTGPMVLEVFSPTDLEGSQRLLAQARLDLEAARQQCAP